MHLIFATGQINVVQTRHTFHLFTVDTFITVRHVQETVFFMVFLAQTAFTCQQLQDLLNQSNTRSTTTLNNKLTI